MGEELWKPELEPLYTDTPKSSRVRWRKSEILGACFCFLVGLLAILYIGVRIFFSNLAIGEMLVIHPEWVQYSCHDGYSMADLVFHQYWPGCDEVTNMSAFDSDCGQPCFSKDLIQEMEAFDLANPGRLVKYMSRSRDGTQDIELSGWWLPPASGVIGPRIILQHGFKQNSNQFRPVLGAYLLRKLGFGVLLNNFRDHCYSGNSSIHIDMWGHAYPLDVLGAWDYARLDPDGILGGVLPPQRVGLMGFSQGAFSTVNALGLDGQVPVAWVDSPPFVPGTVFWNGARLKLEELGLPFLANVFIRPAWNSVLRDAAKKGVDLEEFTPEKVLPRGPPSRRPIFVVGNLPDDTVPYTDTKALAALLKEMPDKYDFQGYWLTDDQCHGQTHVINHLVHADAYLYGLCKFFRKNLMVDDGSSCEKLSGAKSWRELNGPSM